MLTDAKFDKFTRDNLYNVELGFFRAYGWNGTCKDLLPIGWTANLAMERLCEIRARFGTSGAWDPAHELHGARCLCGCTSYCSCRSCGQVYDADALPYREGEGTRNLCADCGGTNG